jgi:hypothetical protein
MDLSRSLCPKGLIFRLDRSGRDSVKGRLASRDLGGVEVLIM